MFITMCAAALVIVCVAVATTREPHFHFLYGNDPGRSGDNARIYSFKADYIALSLEADHELLPQGWEKSEFGSGCVYDSGHWHVRIFANTASSAAGTVQSPADSWVMVRIYNDSPNWMRNFL